MKILSFVALLAIGLLLSPRVPAATSANANSPLGINLNYLSYYDPEQPFLNIFKTSGINHNNPSAWSTRNADMASTNESQYLQLDADGYPTTLKANSSDPNQQFTQVCTLLLNGLPKSNGGSGLPYRAGQYVVLYDGIGSMAFGIDATLVSQSQNPSGGGRYVINVANPNNGFWVCITQTDATNHLRNIRVVKAEEESLLDQGNIYTPAFLQMLSRFRVIRAMQWLKIDDTPAPPGTWANRPLLSDAGWGSGEGVPLEAVVSLCNALSADCWINIPHTADDNYITQAATLVHQQLGNTQKVYVEFSNEVWNNIYPQYTYAADQGLATWPGNTDKWKANRDWYGMRTAQMCDIWNTVWGGDSSRVHCVLGAQAASTPTATESLDCPLWSGAPCYKHHITDVAIAPYFSIFTGNIPTQWTSLDQNTLLSDVFSELSSGGLITGGYTGGELKEDSDWEAAYKAALAPYNLPFISYEGGQSLLAGPLYQDGSPVVNAFIAANRDPRMGSAYTTALNNWKANGGHTYVLYDDVYGPNMYGEWGALESYMDTITPLSSAPPKWQAIQNFISQSPCWWPNCAGTIAEVPNAPSGFRASH